MNRILILAAACLLVVTQSSGVWAANAAQHARPHYTATAPLAEVPDLYSPGARAVRTPVPVMPPNFHEAYPRADM